MPRLVAFRAVAMSLALVIAACAEPGVGAQARLPVSDADRIEVQEVFWDHRELQRQAEPASPTPFGEGAIPLSSTSDPEVVERLVAAVGEARYIDTGNVVIDLQNPDLEVLFFEGESLLARLGYYMDNTGPWGEYGVRGRWMEQEHWRLLELTTELPRQLTDDR